MTTSGTLGLAKNQLAKAHSEEVFDLHVCCSRFDHDVTSRVDAKSRICSTTCVSCRSGVLPRCIAPSTATAVPHFPREMIIFILLVFTECIQASGVHGFLPSLPTWTQDSAWHHPENGTPVRQTATEYREKGPSQPPLWSGASLTRDARGSYERLPTGHHLVDLG